MLGIRSPYLVLLVGASCHHSVPANPLEYTTGEVAANATLPQPDYRALPEQQQKVVQGLHDATIATIRLPEFRQQLERIDALLGSPSADPLSGERLAEIYFGRRSEYASLPLCYGFESGGGSETARTGLSKTSPCRTDETVASITLRSVTLDRSQSKVLETRACAVNTLAHEWTHAITITDPQLGHRMVFEDGDHDEQRGAVASYVVGAVAQCTYLANASPDPRTFRLVECVEAVGTNAFNTASCTQGWSQSFYGVAR